MIVHNLLLCMGLGERVRMLGEVRVGGLGGGTNVKKHPIVLDSGTLYTRHYCVILRFVG